MMNSDIDFLLHSSPSENNEEDVLELSDDSDQPRFSKSEHHGTISPCIINFTVQFIFWGISYLTWVPDTFYNREFL
jgi:hypothetical protein